MTKDHLKGNIIITILFVSDGQSLYKTILACKKELLNTQNHAQNNQAGAGIEIGFYGVDGKMIMDLHKNDICFQCSNTNCTH